MADVAEDWTGIYSEDVDLSEPDGLTWFPWFPPGHRFSISPQFTDDELGKASGNN